MTEISYATAPVPVRDDMTAAHRRVWRQLAKPGNWWTGAERVSIAAEVRNAPQCALCVKRKNALSPHAVEGVHDRVSTLPATAIDVIHRVTTDPNRLTKSWFDKTMAAGEISDGHYIEIIGEVVAIVSVDSFCRGIGMPLHSLPEPEPGEPSHYRPAAAALESAWTPMIPDQGAIGPEADLWQVGRSANVIRALSLVPDAVRQLLDLSAAHYISIENFMNFTWRRSLSRAQLELIAGRVSALRECFY